MICIVFIQNGAEDVTQHDNFIEKPQPLIPGGATDTSRQLEDVTTQLCSIINTLRDMTSYHRTICVTSWFEDERNCTNFN